MTIHVVIPTTPKIGLELVSAELVGGLMSVRVYVANSAGDFPLTGQDSAPIFSTGQGPWQQLQEALTYCGITTPAQTWITSVTKGQAMTELLKWIREVMIPKILAAIGRQRTSTAAPVLAGNYTEPKDLFTDILKSIKWTVGSDGSVSGAL